MLSTTSLLSHLKNDYPQFSFELGKDFLWSSSDNTIYYADKVPGGAAFLFHELSHAILGHIGYSQDIQLLTMERQAWDYAIELATLYGVSIPTETVQSTIDSYRDWLHMRSKCTNCSATGMQIDKDTYTCIACDKQWRVNEARVCALRRYETK